MTLASVGDIVFTFGEVDFGSVNQSFQSAFGKLFAAEGCEGILVAGEGEIIIIAGIFLIRYLGYTLLVMSKSNPVLQKAIAFRVSFRFNVLKGFLIGIDFYFMTKKNIDLSIPFRNRSTKLSIMEVMFKLDRFIETSDRFGISA